MISKRSNERDRHIGRLISRRRHELAISQGRLGDQIGVTFQQIQKYEKGINRVAASRLPDIAQALDCSVAYFYKDMPRISRAFEPRAQA